MLCTRPRRRPENRQSRRCDIAYLYPHAGQAREARGVPAAAGAPSNGTSEVQTLTVTGTPTGGTFKLEFKGQRTAAIAYNAAAAAVVAALEALSSIGTGGVTATGTLATATFAVVVTFAGAQAARAQPLLSVVESALTGGTTPAVTPTETTPGVDGTLRDAPIGTGYVNLSDGKRYTKTATSTWVLVGGQS